MVKEQEKLLSTVNDQEKIIILNRLASIFYRNQPARAIDYGNQALKLAERLNDQNEKANALVFMANAYQVQGNLKKSFNFAQEALRISEKLGDQSILINALNTMGFILMSCGDYEEALKKLIRALEICDEIEDLPRKSGIYYQLGNLYFRMEDHQKAMECYQYMLNYAESKGNLQIMGFAINNIGLVYNNRKQYQKALECFNKALNLFTQVKNSYGATAATANLGLTYGHLDNYDKALEYLYKAIESAKENGNVKAVYDNLIEIGHQYYQLKNYTNAALNYERALKMTSDIGDKNSLERIYLYLSDLYSAQKNYKMAMEYLSKSNDIKYQLVDEQKNLRMSILLVRYEAEKKAREIEILQKNSEIQRITRNAFIASFVLALVILVIIFKKYLYLIAFWKKHKYIAQYRLISRIGWGGMSTVFKAQNIKDKHDIAAIKVLNDELSTQDTTRKRFKLEGDIIDKLDHPNIIKIFGRGEHQEKLYIAMEFLDGKTLAEKIEAEGMISLPGGLDIMKQIAAALTYIHRLDIIHRDLKPGNIMIIEKEGEKNLVKLLDFGLSRMKFQTRLTMTGMLVGTTRYMAPEQISQLISSPAGDVFNLGVIFYEMLTGRAAFTGDTFSEIKRNILFTMPTVPTGLRPGIPGDLNDLVMEMLAKDPEQRPTAESVLTRLSKVIEM